MPDVDLDTHFVKAVASTSSRFGCRTLDSTLLCVVPAGRERSQQQASHCWWGSKGQGETLPTTKQQHSAGGA